MTMKDYIQICKIIYKYKKYIQKSTLEERRMHRRHLLMFSHRNSARLCGKNQRISLGNISIIINPIQLSLNDFSCCLSSPTEDTSCNKVDS